MRTGLVSGTTLAILLALSGVSAGAVNYPFGSHPLTYAAGTIRPNHVSQAALDQTVRDFYDAWKARYVRQTCGAGRHVVLSATRPGNLTVSEAHGYGMMITALMAGHDPEARAIFDGMYAYFREHPSVLTPHLMAWYQTTSCASAAGADSASDGDLDIAYALLLADKQWGSCGGIDYAEAARQVLDAIEVGEIDATGRYVRLGDWTDPSDPHYYDATRSSDFMPDHLRAFAGASGESVWTAVLDHTYAVIDAVQTDHSPATGLLPDFIAAPLGAAAPVPPGFLEGPNDGAYHYNACRGPWRLGTDYVVSGDARARTALERITAWMRGATADDPRGIASGYQLDGTPSGGSNYLSMAFVAPLGVGAMTDASNQTWLNDIWDLIVATPLDAERYYENTLKLLGMIVMSGNWWTPSVVTGGCTPESTRLCTTGGYVSGLQVTLAGLTSGPGRQSLRMRGMLFFPQGIPAAAPYTDGAQLAIEDVGKGDVAIFELSRFTTPVPPQASGVCGARDGWNASPSRILYRNSSTALDPPACTPESARGLSRLGYRPQSALDLDAEVTVRRTTLAPPAGALRVTFVLGASQMASDAGHCSVSLPVACTAKGRSVRCR